MYYISDTGAYTHEPAEGSTWRGDVSTRLLPRPVFVLFCFVIVGIGAQTKNTLQHFEHKVRAQLLSTLLSTWYLSENFGGRQEGGRERQHRHTDRDCMNRCVCVCVYCDVDFVVWERRAIHIDCMLQHVDVSPGVVASGGETNAWVVPSANSIHKPASPKICNMKISKHALMNVVLKIRIKSTKNQIIAHAYVYSEFHLVHTHVYSHLCTCIQ
jgi:hypothetical protein